MTENQEYPKTIHASVLLLDNKILNWKVGYTCWKTVDKALCSQQPVGVLLKFVHNPEAITVEHTSFVCNSAEEVNLLFTKKADSFYKKWKMSPLFPKDMIKPY